MERNKARRRIKSSVGGEAQFLKKLDQEGFIGKKPLSKDLKEIKSEPCRYPRKEQAGRGSKKCQDLEAGACLLTLLRARRPAWLP